ncbi:MAG TPA: V-type ATP synthase subunit E [Sedimentisphaerales bacterium]|nr:V-type ATP synthase subunit E [Sedimentisphaerales bacterium]
MEAQQVTEKILADANAEADKIKKEADEKRADEQAKADEQMQDYKKQTEALAQKAAQDKKLHLLASARMDIAREFLAEKRKILDEVFSQARAQLLNLPDDDYRRLCSKLMNAAVETGDEEVIIDKNERRIDQEFIKQINRELGPGYKGNLRLSDERRNIGAGFILKRGKIKNNVSLDVLLDRARKGLEIDLAKELFQS